MSPQPLPPGRLRDRTWPRFLEGPDPALLEELYVPMLTEAVRYDRCCAYFSSTALAAAARGFGRLIERLLAMGSKAPRPAVRLIVNEELAAEDVRALTETADVSKLEVALKRRLTRPRDVLVKRRLAMLGWLVKAGLLEVRVGIMRHGQGILHGKFGIATDQAGDAVVFAGSGNESARGLRANYEEIEISASWADKSRHDYYRDRFDKLWQDKDAYAHTVTLPEALRLKLIKFAPKEPPIAEPSNALARQKAAMIWRFIVEAPYLPNGGPACDATAIVDLWPHQRRVVAETAESWPAGRLLCDEVGLGKTIEAILILRRLLAGRGVRRALILLPAGLLSQWQAELREKGGLIFPYLEGSTTLVWPDGTSQRVSALAEALQQDLLLMSRETARTENNLPSLLAAEPWDLVVLDEAHAARRREQEEAEFNSGTLLLALLRKLQLRRRARGILLLSATPMQTHPWEPWDLLSVLGEGGSWLADFATVRNFYRAVAAVAGGSCDIESARKAAALIVSDPGFPGLPDQPTGVQDAQSVANRLAFAAPSQRRELARWLRQGSPLARRMHRNTRGTLGGYHSMGLLPQAPPKRSVEDILFDYQDSAERAVYNGISRYIETRFDQLEHEKPGKGFVMTIYRRRAASSPQALERSLQRRRDGLFGVERRRAYDYRLLPDDAPERVDSDDLPEGEGIGKVSAALPEDPRVAGDERIEVERLLAELRDLGGRDSKRDCFFEVLRRVTEDGRPVLVFTEYTDTLDYLLDILVPYYGQRLGCYRGAGGRLWDGHTWQSVTKDVITKSLQSGELLALICTDAASEGLNLQAAGSLVNYDLPWNPSKIEQRIGRIDRIGQRYPEVQVVNLFLKDSVDDKVYRALRRRCGLFEHFVGAMQPVLARARRMLAGKDTTDAGAIDATATDVERDPLAQETYIESLPEAEPTLVAPVTRKQVEAALAHLTSELGFRVKSDTRSSTHVLSGPGLTRTVFSSAVEALERDQAVHALCPLATRLCQLVEILSRPGERLPLVVASHRHGAFRVSVAYWLSRSGAAPVETLDDLTRMVEAWDGQYPDPDQWQRAVSAARAAAKEQAEQLARRAATRERDGLLRQVEAARLRLQRELGRYLVCVDSDAADLNDRLYQQMSRDTAGAQRLKQCFEKLGDYPEWSGDLVRELELFGREVTANRRKARLLGSELAAALQDPRWEAGSLCV